MEAAQTGAGTAGVSPPFRDAVDHAPERITNDGREYGLARYHHRRFQFLHPFSLAINAAASCKEHPAIASTKREEASSRVASSISASPSITDANIWRTSLSVRTSPHSMHWKRSEES